MFNTAAPTDVGDDKSSPNKWGVARVVEGILTDILRTGSVGCRVTIQQQNPIIGGCGWDSSKAGYATNHLGVSFG